MRVMYHSLAKISFVCLVLVKLTCLSSAQQPASQKRLISIDDLYRLDWVRSPVLSPDGKRVVYVRNWIDPATKQERSSLWVAEGTAVQPRPLEEGEPDGRSPVFSPDGKWIAFLSTRPRPDGWEQTPATPPESDPATDVWIISAEGGEAVPLAGPEKPYGRVFNDGFYGRVVFSPSGKQLVFVADDGSDPRTPEEIAYDVYVLRPDQGEGYTGWGPAQVWLAELGELPKAGAAQQAQHESTRASLTTMGKLPPERIRRLTCDDVWYGDPQWSPDGRYVVVHANKTPDRESVRFSINKNFDLWMIDVQTSQQQQLSFGPGPDVSPRFSPDGRQLVCLSIPRKGSHRDVFNFTIITLGSAGPRSELLYDHHAPVADHPPHLPPAFPLPVECWDGTTHVVYNAERGVESPTMRVNLRTGIGATVDLAAADPNAPSIVGRMRRRAELTPPSNRFLAERYLSERRVFRWQNSEGMHLEGILTIPPPQAGSPPYKLLLYPHGGPHGRSGMGFDFTVELFAAHGYAVFQPNFRGSAGYGQAFIDADRADFGGGDMRDILTGIDRLVEQNLVRADKQFVYGISYGGFMTCWLVGHTRQFRAAVAQNAVTDLATMWGLSDLPSWTEWEFGGRPWEVPLLMRKHSPMTYVASVRTPTLVLHAREDRRCPVAMGIMFHKALASLGVPTEMVIYPHEGHNIQQPKHREDILRRTLEWFEKYETYAAEPAPLP